MSSGVDRFTTPFKVEARPFKGLSEVISSEFDRREDLRWPEIVKAPVSFRNSALPAAESRSRTSATKFTSLALSRATALSSPQSSDWKRRHKADWRRISCLLRQNAKAKLRSSRSCWIWTIHFDDEARPKIEELES